MTNLNPEKVVKFTADGKDYSLYIGNGALRKFELETGETAAKTFIDAANRGEVSMEKLTILMRLGLSQVHPDLSMEDVDLIIDYLGFQDAITYLTDALGKAFPSAANRGNGQTPPKTAVAG